MSNGNSRHSNRGVIRRRINFVFERFPVRRRICEDLPTGPISIQKYARNLSRLFSDQTHESLFIHMYDNLTILDAKSGSLLQFNSVLMAIFAIFIAKTVFSLVNVIGFLGIVLALLSSLLLLQVVWVHWSTSDHMHSPSRHMAKLLSVRKTRTICYRIAWNLSQLSGVCLFIFIVIKGCCRLAAHTFPAWVWLNSC